VISTERLVLRPLELDDADAIQNLFPHWEIVRYLASPPIPWPYPANGALTFVRDVAMPAMERSEEWIWTIRLKELPGQMIGCIALHDIENNNRGFWLAPQWQRRGLMTEACEAITDYWFGVLDRPVLRTPRAVENVASRRIAEKTGMKFVRTEMKNFVCGPMLAEIWEITKDEWRLRR
jgi:RimJ/RimL family protein N-acetyltransferase